MKLYGIQKLTLLDYPGKVACTVFTGGCNFRCPFCHNATLVLRPGECDPIEADELIAFLKKRSGVLEGVCITGGEPLMNTDIAGLIGDIRALGYLVKLDTNGSFPNRLRELTEGGYVDYVAMDIKNSPEKYPATVGMPELDYRAVRESMELLMGGGVPYEFRTTVVKELHEAEDFRIIGEEIAGCDAYYIQSFKDSGDILSTGCTPYSKDELETFLGIIRAYVPNAKLREL